MKIPFTLTNDTVTVFIDGEPRAVTKGSPNYESVRKAVFDEDWDAIPKLLTVEGAVEAWANQPTSSETGTTVINKANKAPKVTVTETAMLVDGEPLPAELHNRALKMMTKNESAEPLFNFWRRLKRNPNKRSVDQLWGFLQHTGIPIQPDGTFLAYMCLRNAFRDSYSCKFDNSPGKTVKMARSKISTDPAQTCHVGLHVGALSYARTFAATTIIVRVDPEHVCCVPNDYNASKMRVCEYTVMGLYGSEMPSTTFQADAPVQTDEPKPVVDAKQKQVPCPPATGTPWDDFNAMTPEVLANQSLDDLRKYARYNCLIAGASKLPGGKDTLLAKIQEALSAAKPTGAPEPVETAPLPDGVEAAVSLPRTGTEWDALNGMNSLQLLEQPLDALRKYATYNCLIVGASKIPGGKMNLVTRILEVRGDAEKHV